MICLTGGKIITMEGDIWEKGYLCIEKGKILDLGPLENKAPFPLKQDETVRIIDTTGCIIMPGMIEAHCHMGIVEEKMGLEGDDCNENVEPVTPFLRAIDAVIVYQCRNHFKKKFAAKGAVRGGTDCTFRILRGILTVSKNAKGA